MELEKPLWETSPRRLQPRQPETRCCATRLAAAVTCCAEHASDTLHIFPLFRFCAKVAISSVEWRPRRPQEQQHATCRAYLCLSGPGGADAGPKQPLPAASLSPPTLKQNRGIGLGESIFPSANVGSVPRCRSRRFRCTFAWRRRSEAKIAEDAPPPDLHSGNVKSPAEPTGRSRDPRASSRRNGYRPRRMNK